MKYYVSPTILNLHHVAITPVNVISSEGGLAKVEATNCPKKFITSENHLHDTLNQAKDALRRNALEFEEKLHYVLAKALEE